MKLNFENGGSAALLLNAVLESTADGILVIFHDSRIAKANKKFKELWKIPAALLETKDDEKLLAFILDQLIQPVLFLKNVQELNDEQCEESHDVLELKDGRIFERYLAPFIMEDKVLGWVLNFRDVTRQKHIEETCKKERVLFRTIIDNMPDSIYAKDSEFRKILANPVNLRNAGCAKESDVLGKTDFDLFPQESALAFYNDDKTVVETGKPVINREESFINKEGRRVWLLTTKLPLRDSNGKVEGIIGVGRDITLTKKNELIRETLYEISESVLVTSDMVTLYQKIHKAVANLMPAKNFYIALYDDKKNLLSFPYMVDEFDSPFTSAPLGRGLTAYVLRKGEPELINAEKNFELRKSGEVELIGTPAAVWLGIPLKNRDKVFGAIVLQDYKNAQAYGNDEMQLLGFISEQIAQAIARKRDAEEIKKYAAELNELNQTKDKFFSIIAHDLKNPFVTLLGFSEILLSDFKDLQTDEILYYINEMKQSADLSFNLLQNLLQWSRSQTGRIEFHPQQLNLKNIVDQNVLLVDKTAEKKLIKIVNNVHTDLFAKADEDMLNTIIRNILTNAIKFTNRNGSITVDAGSTKNFAQVMIKDSGVGMDSATIDKLFRLDVSHTTAGTEKEAGTGLGLILCKEFVEKNGGKIWAESELGVGTTFSFTIPLS